MDTCTINPDIEAKADEARLLEMQSEKEAGKRASYINHCLNVNVCPSCGAHLSKIRDNYGTSYMRRRCQCGFFHSRIRELVIFFLMLLVTLGLMLWSTTAHARNYVISIPILLFLIVLINEIGGTMEIIRFFRRLFGLSNPDAKLDAVLNHLKLETKLVPEHYEVKSTDTSK